jgi:hypothetical protein
MNRWDFFFLRRLAEPRVSAKRRKTKRFSFHKQ